MIWGSNLPGPVIGGFTFFPIRIIVIAWVIYSLVKQFKTNESIKKETIAVLVFLLFGLIPYIWAPSNPGFLTDFSVYFTMIICFLMIKSLIKTEDDIKLALISILINYHILCFASIYESFTGNYIASKVYDYYLVRKNFFGLYMPSGGLGNVNNLAVVLLCIMPFSLYATERFKFGLILRVFAFLIGSFVILLTGSRTGYIGIIIIAFLYLTYKLIQQKKPLMFMLFIITIPIVISALIISLQDYASFIVLVRGIDNEDRWFFWNQTLQTSQEFMFMGCGLGNSLNVNTILYGANGGNAHNHFLEILCEFGLFGLIAHIFMFCLMIPQKENLTIKMNPIILIFIVVFIISSICPSSMIGMYILWALFALCIRSKKLFKVQCKIVNKKEIVYG